VIGAQERDQVDQPSTGGGRASRAVAKRAAKKVVRHGGRKLLVALGVKGGFWVGLVVLLLLVIAAAAHAASRPAAVATCSGPGAAGCAAGDGSWDAGNIISDAVFYDAAAMSVQQIQEFLDRVGGSCVAVGCLRSASYAWGPVTVPWCAPLAGGSGGFAALLAAATAACGVNPQVVLVMIQKESQGLTRPPPAALTGFGCPDTGPGGSANCDAGSSGVWAQTWGLVQAFAHLRADPSRINYPVGQTSQILWNVAETGCGAGPVLVANTATASLYTYTPYQPNAASLASYPGTGDRCSSYGNRNFHRLFTAYFGSTGGGRPGTGGAAAGGVAVVVNGPTLTLPDDPNVAPPVRGAVVGAGSAGIARGIAAGLALLGLPYVWGGGGDGAGPDDGCARGGGDLNSCRGLSGFDCSGLTAYVLVAGGFASPGGNSEAQRNWAHAVAWEQGRPGDIIGFPGHVAIFLGVIAGAPYILEASTVGVPVHVVALTRGGHDPVMYRFWS
jgi:cell wall-associated NlpC family hydrolase